MSAGGRVVYLPVRHSKAGAAQGGERLGWFLPTIEKGLAVHLGGKAVRTRAAERDEELATWFEPDPQPRIRPH